MDSWIKEGDTLKIKVDGDFAFGHCLKFLNRNTQECLHRVISGQLFKMLNIEQKLILFEITAHGNTLHVRALNGKLPKTAESYVVNYLVALFDLHRDLTPFYNHMHNHPLMKEVVAPLKGLRLIGIPDLFEALCWSVIGQQINLNFAYNLKRRLVEAAGSHLSWQGQDYWSFPEPQVVRDIADKDFQDWQFSRGKYLYIKGIAEAMITGGLHKQHLQQLTPRAAYEELIALKGIGPWSANYVLMKCLGYTEAYPIQDVGLHNAIKLHQGSVHKPTLQELEKLGEEWHPWQGYATFYLWHTLIS